MAAFIGAIGGTLFSSGPVAALTSIPGTIASAKGVSAGLTIFSALSQISAGNAQAAALRDQSAAAGLQAGQEVNKGIQERISLREELQNTLAGQSVAFAANGIDLSAGTPVTARNEAVRKSEGQLATSRENTLINVKSQRIKQRRLMLDANAARKVGITKAVGTIGDDLMGVLNRG